MTAEPTPEGPTFAHLHVKSQFTLLGALGQPDKYVKLALEQGYKHLAITDEMNLFGAVAFYKAAKAEGLHPVIGAELIVAPGSRLDKNKPRDNFRLVALIREQQGYVSLNHLLSEGYLTGRHFVPRIDKELLQQHHEGLILLSGDLRGEVGRLLARGKLDEARAAALWYRDLVGEGNFYLELMDLGWGAVSAGLGDEQDQREVNVGLRQLSAETGIPLVVTNNVHYPNQEDSFPHEVLLALGMQKTMQDEFRFRFPSDQFFLKSPQQMEALFPDDAEARANTLRIAERCRFDFDFDTYHFPVYPYLEGRSPEEALADLAWDGFAKRMEKIQEREAAKPTWDRPWEETEQVYRDRMVEELGIINSMKFAAYFLIVFDFINWAKDHDIPVGPGRGSGAGSLVLYSLRITDIDPMPYKLLFERFLNPERISMPDVDVDFCQDRRTEVIDYVNASYGGVSRVTQIITFGKMLAKGVLRDTGRVLGFSFSDVSRIAELVPDQLGITLAQSIKQEPRIQLAMDEDPKVAQLVNLAMALEGTTRHASVHAAGVVVADDDLRNYTPLYRSAKEGDPTVTQYDMKYAESIGLIKFDFLGLKTLTQVKNALDMAREQGKTEWRFQEFSGVPVDDENVYKLLSRGDTLGVFQLESSGMRELLRSLKPSNFEDIMAVAALYRPGPMGMKMHTAFVEFKHGRQPVTYPHPSIRPVLEDTYGVVVFQEQVMQISQLMAGYSLGEADLLRRAMGKKKKEEMDKQKVRFLTGAQERNIPPKVAEQVFETMAQFAAYGFNKSHTAAYGLVAYQTAWVKHYLPAEFYASLLTIESSNTDKVLLYLDDARKHDIEVLPPDVNESRLKFTVVDGRVRFGLTAVKNVGDNAIEAILEARQDGPFQDIGDFVGRVDLKRVNKRVVEALIKCGAFDSMGLARAALMDSLDRILEFGQREARDRASGQFGLFGGGAGAASSAGRLAIAERAEWHERDRLAIEKQALGFYITGHPMNAFAAEIERFADANTAELREIKKGDVVKLAGVVASMREVLTKAKAQRMAFVQLEDMVGSAEVTVFPKTYAEVEEHLKGDEPVLLTGKFEEITEDGLAKLLCDDVKRLSDVREAQTVEMRFRLGFDEVNDEVLGRLAATLRAHPGNARTRVELVGEDGTEVLMDLGGGTVRPSRECLEELEAIFGRSVVAFR